MRPNLYDQYSPPSSVFNFRLYLGQSSPHRGSNLMKVYAMRDDTLGTTFTRYYRHTEGVIDTMLQANLGLSKLVSFGAMFLGKLARIADLGG